MIDGVKALPTEIDCLRESKRPASCTPVSLMQCQFWQARFRLERRRPRQTSAIQDRQAIFTHSLEVHLNRLFTCCERLDRM